MTNLENQKIKKYLILLCGSPRGGEKTWDTLYKYVLNHLDADLAVCYGDTFEISQSLLDHAKYNWVFEEPKSWSEYYSSNFEGNWKEYFLLGEKYGMAGGIDDYSGSGAIVSGLKNIIHSNYISILEKYDYIIYSRFDQFYTDYHPEFNGDNIWIPKGEDYFGVCDRHSIFPSKYSNDFFNICSYIDSPLSIERKPNIVNPEAVFLNYLEYINLDKKIKRINRFQMTVSNSGDNTRWRIAKYNLYFYKGIKMKYPTEFKTSIKNLINKKGSIGAFIFSPKLFMNYIYLKFREYTGFLIPNFLKLK